MNEIIVAIVQAIKNLGYNIDATDLKKSLFHDIGVNSLHLVELIVHVEELFDFEFDIEDMVITDDLSIERIVRIIEKHSENRKA